MLVTPLPIVTFVRLVQSSKALFPILVTLFGIVMPVKLVQPLKEIFPILVTGSSSIESGIIRFPDADFSQSVIVTDVPSLL